VAGLGWGQQEGVPANEAAPAPEPPEAAPVAEETGADGPVVEEPVVESPDPAVLVEALGSELYKEREAATKALWELGERGLATLRVAQKSDDPEVAHRARRLVRRIQTGITPDTPQQIVDLVERYHRGDPNAKRDTLEKLRELQAYEKILRLYRFEEDEAAIEECAEVVELVVVPAVKKLVKGEEWAEARNLLALAPRTPDNLRRRAAFSRFRGELDADLARAGADRDREWELALRRANGDLAGALALAKELGRKELVAGLSLFEGDPLPYFDWVVGNPNFSATMRLNAEIARNRWTGDEKEAAKLAQALVDEAREASADDPRLLVSLMLNGYWGEVLSLMEGRREFADNLYAYYEMVELPDKAVGIYGYKGTPGERAAWIDEQMARFEEKPGRAVSERALLLSVSSFLVNRGEREAGFEIVRRMGRIIEKRGGGDDWLKFVGILGDNGGVQYELAFAVAVDAMAGRKEDLHAARVIGAIFRNSEIAMRHWERLKREENLSPRERLLLLGGIYGMVEMDPARVDPVLNRLFTKAVTAAGEERRQGLADLVEPAAYRDDTNAVCELLAMLSEIDGIDRWSHSLGVYHSYMSDWEQAAKAWETEVRRNPDSTAAISSLAATYMRMGRNDRARELLDEPGMLDFDEVDRLAQLADVFTSYNLREEAGHVLRRILGTSDPLSRSWVASGAEFALHAKRRGDWRVAAAFMEIEALFDVRDRPTYVSPLMYLRKRFAADLMRGLALHEEGKPDEAMALFDRSFQFLIGDGVLADDFFPLLRQAGLTEAHDRYFEIAWERIMASIEAYPKTHNTYNSAAWLASRSMRRLDEAERLETKALEMRPKQAAYLDTMAEIWFARGSREKAVEWSTKAVMDSENAGHSRTGGAELRGQFERFKADPFPVP
jgi:tetratricopeptide (TPR) repeat protein